MTNVHHESNRRVWDASAKGGTGQVDPAFDWRRAFTDASHIFAAEELRWFGDVRGRKVCVLGSGDNVAVFALAGLGATVTSVDISEQQLRIASDRARELGAAIEFVRADVADLSPIPAGTFDIAFTGGHVAVWVSDLHAYYREAIRILKPGGLLIVSEYHPVRRIWKEKPDGLEVDFHYFDRGPNVYERPADPSSSDPTPLPAYEFHWTVSDIIGAVMDTGAELLRVEEFGTEPESWERVNLTGLPRVLLVAARKRI